MSPTVIIQVIIELLAGAGVFLVGVKLLSTNIEQLAGGKIKSLFKKTASNKIVNVGIGAVTTALVQSSGVTTVLIVGFVNVGVISLYQATAMIMGANIGTTLTAQLAALSTFSVSKYIKFISFVGIMLSMTFKKESVRKVGLVVAGFGLIFIGLSLMSASLKPISESDEMRNIFTTVTNPFLLFFIGIFLTALVQSSAAITSIIISIAIAGLTIGDGGNSVLYIILGTNIGSCVTAVMSSIGAGANAKRASLIHLLFNTFGSIIFFIVLLCYPDFMHDTFGAWFPETATQIAMFHTFFNVIGTLIFLPISKIFVKISEFLIKDDEDTEIKTNLDERFLSNTSFAIEQVEKESMRLADLAMHAFDSGFRAFVNKDLNALEDVTKSIEDASSLGKQITDFLIKVSSRSTMWEEKKISDIHNNIGDIMRIAEIADNFTKYTRRVVNDGLIFSEKVMVDLDTMCGKINFLYDMTKKVVLEKNLSLMNYIDKTEDEIDAMRKSLIDGHIERLNKGECKPENSSVFINMVSNMERLGDHLTYIAYTVK